MIIIIIIIQLKWLPVDPAHHMKLGGDITEYLLQLIRNRNNLQLLIPPNPGTEWTTWTLSGIIKFLAH